MEKIIAIGDIHGQIEKLNRLWYKIHDQITNHTIVFMGDYIDRGPNSKGVIDFLLALKKKYSNSFIFLKGNHEDMFLDYLSLGGSHGEVFILNGGQTTLQSYNGPRNIPFEHTEFFLNLDTYYYPQQAPYIFVHAGLRPKLKFAQQNEEDMIWIREEFIYFDGSFPEERTVVFGHTPMRSGEPLLHANKIGIDTGAAYGGPLTALFLPEKKIVRAH